MSPFASHQRLAATDGGDRGPIWDGAVPSAGVVFGARISEAWAVEVEIEKVTDDPYRVFRIGTRVMWSF